MPLPLPIARWPAVPDRSPGPVVERRALDVRRRGAMRRRRVRSGRSPGSLVRLTRSMARAQRPVARWRVTIAQSPALANQRMALSARRRGAIVRRMMPAVHGSAGVARRDLAVEAPPASSRQAHSEIAPLLIRVESENGLRVKGGGVRLLAIVRPGGKSAPVPKQIAVACSDSRSRVGLLERTANALSGLFTILALYFRPSSGVHRGASRRKIARPRLHHPFLLQRRRADA